MPFEEDVRGHRMESRWDQGPSGMYRIWVHIDDNVEANKLDPTRWNTLSDRIPETAEVHGSLQRVEESG
jgi:hypothetical protein